MTYFAKITAMAITATMIAGPALADDFKRIRKEADFRSLVVGKTISAGSGYLTLHADGRLTGAGSQGALIGNWKWSRKFFCRNLNIGGKNIGSDCQVVKMAKDGKSVMFIRQMGKGEAKTYDIE